MISRFSEVSGMDLAINRTASGFVLAESAHGEAGPTYVTKLSAKLTC